MRLLRRFLALNRADRWLLIEAWFYLGAARLALLFLPFRRIAQRLGRQQPAPSAKPQGEPAPPEAARVAWAIDTMSRHTPWESACLAQAISGKFMLRRRSLSSRLYLGTRKDERSSLVAHAWLQVGGATVLGGAGSDGFTALTVFDDEAP